MLSTFHNHSQWSDGRSPFADMYAFADEARVDILGLSDHFCVYPDGTSPDWSLTPAKLDDYLADVLSFRDRGEIEIRVGLEFDWFENHRAVIAPFVASAPLDYRIGAVHHVDGQQFDVSPSFWTAKTTAERDEVFRRYWRLVREMAESGLFDIAAHLDLPKKLGFHPEADLSRVIDEALEAIKAGNLVVELNTAGFGKPCADAYPSLTILQKCRAREIPVTLSSDGHIPQHLLFEFERGLSRLAEAGFKTIARFRERERWFEPLEDALRSRRI